MKKIATAFEFNNIVPNWREKKITFTYTTYFKNNEPIQFSEALVLDESVPINTESLALEPILQGLHLILGISYWKAYCPSEIRIKNYTLSKKQAEFWYSVYTKGLGEFFYKNKIDFHGLIQFPFSDGPLRQSIRLPGSNRALLAIGGGKDSIVSAQILKEGRKDFTAFYSHPLHQKTIDLLGVSSLKLERHIDPKLINLNKQEGVYNGHIPVSVIWAFTSVLFAVLYDYKYLVFSNERSANYGSVKYLGEEINHQWSKSFEFEKMFQNYIHEFITPDIHYFSLLRPFYEIEIVRRFSKLEKYFSSFTSCNKNFTLSYDSTHNLWCGECAKCAFVYCMLAAFLPKEKLSSLFGQNLYQNEDLCSVYRQLLGIRDIKPFDCVGTPEEGIVAFYKAYKRNEYADDSAMKMFAFEVLPTVDNIEKLEREVFSYGDDTNIPQIFKSLLNPKVQSPCPV